MLPGADHIHKEKAPHCGSCQNSQLFLVVNWGENVQVKFSTGKRKGGFCLREVSLLSHGIKVTLAAKRSLVLTSIASPTNEEAASYFFVCSPGVKQSCTSGLEIEDSLCCRLSA